ncbi:MAG TPA: hypothetical protein VJ697_02105 [Nitrososphaeraceae archaeon]|nr:hypothetical protein [Nitrososphaeraceae archaeon]
MKKQSILMIDGMVFRVEDNISCCGFVFNQFIVQYLEYISTRKETCLLKSYPFTVREYWNSNKMGHSVYQNRIETFDNYYLYTRNEGNLLHEYNGIQFIVSMQRHNI